MSIQILSGGVFLQRHLRCNVQKRFRHDFDSWINNLQSPITIEFQPFPYCLVDVLVRERVTDTYEPADVIDVRPKVLKQLLRQNLSTSRVEFESTRQQ